MSRVGIVDRDRLLEFLYRLVELPELKQREAEVVVGIGLAGLDFDS